jgi:hypothetical protein
MNGRRACATIALSVVLGLLAISHAEAQGTELDFVSPESVTADLSGKSSEELSVWLKNGTDKAVSPEFEAVLENGDGEAAGATVAVVGDMRSVGADEVARFRLRLEDATKSSGQLVAKAPGVTPASVAITVGPKLDLSRGVNGALIFPFVAAFVLVLVAAVVAGALSKLTAELGTAELEFSKAFASTLTAVGALLGTIISASVLPEDTVNLSKAGFTGLNLTFGIAIAVAGVVYSAVQKSFVEESGGKKERKLKGYTLPFLLAALITTWAVYGEIWTMWRMFEEIGRAGQGFSDFAVVVVQVLLAVAALATVPYTIIRVRAAVRPPEASEPTVGAADSPPTVSLL